MPHYKSENGVTRLPEPGPRHILTSGFCENKGRTGTVGDGCAHLAAIASRSGTGRVSAPDCRKRIGRAETGSYRAAPLP